MPTEIDDGKATLKNKGAMPSTALHYPLFFYRRDNVYGAGDTTKDKILQKTKLRDPETGAGTPGQPLYRLFRKSEKKYHDSSQTQTSKNWRGSLYRGFQPFPRIEIGNG